MSITIKRLTADNWFDFSQIRLKALQTDPNVFGSNYQKESQLTEADWRVRLKNNTVLLICEKETPIGMTGISIDRDDESGKTAILWGSWLAPLARAAGSRQRFVEFDVSNPHRLGKRTADRREDYRFAPRFKSRIKTRHSKTRIRSDGDKRNGLDGRRNGRNSLLRTQDQILRSNRFFHINNLAR